MFIVSVLPVLAMFIVSFISYFQCRLRPFISPVVLAMFIVSVPDVLVCSLCQCLVFSLCSLCHSSTTFSVGYVPSFLQSFSLCSLSQCLMFSYVHCVSASCSRYVHCVTHLLLQCRLRPFISPVVLAMFIVSVPDVLVCSLCQCFLFSLCSLCHSSATSNVGYVHCLST